jgi:hypothetical protein
MIRFSILVLFSAILYCCATKTIEQSEPGGKLQGLHKWYFPDGQLYLEVNFKDSLPHGTSTRYMKNGQILEQAEYAMGARHGITRTYHENGQLSTETPYDSGRIHGIQRKFRRDGTPAFEAPYYYDNPCVGIKEYYTSGNPVTNYPTIVVSHKDDILRSGEYVLELRLSDGSKSVQFYQGKLTDEKFVGRHTVPIQVKDGVGRLYYRLDPGDFIMEELNIIAKAKTDLRNYYITHTKYNLAIENR